MARFAQHLRCTNDTNGNPRRIWAIHDTNDGDPGVTYVDEGYSGRAAVKGLPEIPGVEITPGCYRELKRLAQPEPNR